MNMHDKVVCMLIAHHHVGDSVTKQVLPATNMRHGCSRQTHDYMAFSCARQVLGTSNYVRDNGKVFEVVVGTHNS